MNASYRTGKQPDQSLRIHHFENASRANGPGLRCVLWVQGCTLGCPGCFNPETHPRDGRSAAVNEVIKWIASVEEPVEGLTISGGEPLQQISAIGSLLALVRAETNLSVVLFSGFSWEEIQKMPGKEKVLDHIDVLIAGRYDYRKRTAKGLTGSTNKTFHILTTRYSAADFEEIPEAEVIIGPDGQIIMSGIDPIQWT